MSHDSDTLICLRYLSALWHVCHALPHTQSCQDSYWLVFHMPGGWFGREESRAGEKAHRYHGWLYRRCWICDTNPPVDAYFL